MPTLNFYVNSDANATAPSGFTPATSVGAVGTAYASSTDDVRILVACETHAGPLDLAAFRGKITVVSESYGSTDPFANPPVFPSLSLAARYSDTLIQGIAFQPGSGTATDGVTVDNCSGVVFEHCRFAGYGGAGAFVGECWTPVRFHACRFETNGIGLICREGRAQVTGSCLFLDNERYGVVCLIDSRLFFLDHAPGQPSNGGTFTVIKTTQIRKEYAAIKVSADSEIWLRTTEIDPHDVIAGYVAVRDESVYRSKDYFGVVLETRSALVGSDNVYFADPAFEEGAPTIPPDRQIKATDGHGTVVIP